MAERLYFMPRLSGVPVYQEKSVEFEYYNGFAVSQKQKSIRSMHDRIKSNHPDFSILEISTKSTDPTGYALSAFNLRYRDGEGNAYPLENIFQSSKVFANGGPYRDLLSMHPKDAKRDERLQKSGRLECFEYASRIWPLEPKSIFYDWIYISALLQNPELSQKILKYHAFTDIEFNHKKSINCQARAAAIFVALCLRNELGIVDTDDFKDAYGSETSIQLSLPDILPIFALEQ